MRIRSAFLIGFTAVAVPGCFASAWISMKALTSWQESREAKRATQIVWDVQQAHTAFIVEMGQTVAAILGSDTDLRQLPASREKTDRTLERARQTAAGDAADDEGISAALTAAREVRAKIAAVLAKPKGERDVRTVDPIIAVRAKHGNCLTTLAYGAAQHVSASSWLTAGLVHLGMQVMDLREYVGQRNLVIHSWIGGQPIRPEQVVDVDQLTGRIDLAWKNIHRMINALPAVPSVMDEAQHQDETFHEVDEVRWLHIVAIARARSANPPAVQPWPEPLNEYRAWTQAAKDNVVRLHDVAMTEALGVAGTQEQRSAVELAIAASLAILTFGASACAIAYLLRRIVTPVVELTRVIDRIAEHEFDVMVPTAARLEEIGRMALAVEALRQDAIVGEQSKQQIVRMAGHDALTGLPNRRLFASELDAALSKALAGEAHFAMLLIDLDRFKPINDLQGHAVGDLVLIEVAKRLSSLAEGGGVVARLGGDEFALLMRVPSDDAARNGTVAAMATRVVRSIAAPILLSGGRADVGASVGISICPAHGRDSEDLLRAADLAMYKAKREGRGSFCFYEPGMVQELRNRAILEADLRDAIDRECIEPYFQPLVDLKAQVICGFELLARWSHPVLGSVPPEMFIPVAEQLGSIDDLTSSVLRRACRDARHWGDNIRLAVNISPAQLQDHALPVRLLAVLSAERFPPSRLEVEVTETALVDNHDAAKQTLDALRGLGIEVALDDFGTGYSSLSHLRELKFNKLKIDRSFIQSMRGNAESEKIVHSVLGLAASLGMPVVAEGIEDRETMNDLIGRGCQFGQGYLFSKAIPATEARALLGGVAAGGSILAA